MGYNIYLEEYSLKRRTTVSEEQAVSMCREKLGEDEDRFDIDWSKVSSLLDVYEAIGFDTDEELEAIVGYDGRYNDEMIDLLEAIAPSLEDGSYIQFIGEQSEHFRYYFQNGKVYEQEAIIEWPEIKEE